MLELLVLSSEPVEIDEFQLYYREMLHTKGKTSGLRKQYEVQLVGVFFICIHHFSTAIL